MTGRPQETTARGRSRFFGLARETVNQKRQRVIRPAWKRLFILMAVLAGISWIGKSAAFYFYFKHEMEFPAVSLLDMLVYPFNHSQMRAYVGDYHIAKALQSLEDGKVQEAWYYVSVGVARSPANLQGRRLLADLYTLTRQYERAANLLYEGIPYAIDDLDYNRHTVSYLLRRQMDTQILNLAQRWLPPSLEEATERQRLFALAAARSHTARGQLNAANQLLDVFKLTESVEGVLIRARILELSGRAPEAKQYLEAQLFQRQDQNTGPLFVELISLAEESGQDEDALRFASLYVVAHPRDFNPRLYLIRQLDRLGKEAERDRAVIEAMRAFAQEPDALLAFASYAADAGDVDLCRRIYSKAMESNLQMAYFSLLLIEAHAVAGQYAKALAYCEELQNEAPSWLESNQFAYNSLLALAHHGLGNQDLAQLSIQRSLTLETIERDSLLATGRRFQLKGWLPQARLYFAEAFNNYPTHSQALTALIEVDLELGNASELTRNLDRVLDLRQPETELLQKALNDLASDRFIFAQNRVRVLQRLQDVIRQRATLPDSEQVARR